MDHLDKAANDRNPTDIAVNTSRHDATNVGVITWVSKHLTALCAIATRTRNLQLADKARETAQELVERVPIDLTQRRWNKITEAVGPKESTSDTVAAVCSRLQAYKELYTRKVRDIETYTNQQLSDYFLTQETGILELEAKLKHTLQNSTDIQDAFDIPDCKVINAAPAKRPQWVPPYLNHAWAIAHSEDPDHVAAPAPAPPTII